MMAETQDQLLRALFATAVESVSADLCLEAHLPPPPAGRTIVIGAGKAAAAMARVVETHWRGALSGAVVTPYGHGVACSHIDIIEAAHPVPDQAGMESAGHMLDLVGNLTANDLVLALISGGGSSLLALPAARLTLADKQGITRDLLRSGAPIGAINTIRKHLSAIKGGRLAQAAHPARVVSLVVSDVPGDNPAIVASGPTAPDPTTIGDARAILADYNIAAPPTILAHLETGEAETPKPGDPAFSDDEIIVIARAENALEAAADSARRTGWVVEILGDNIEGEARDIAQIHAARVRAQIQENSERPHILLSGGETSVTLEGQDGSGGRNTEYLLALGVALEGISGVWAIACDTDGIDGNSDAAGAVLRPDSLDRARALGLNPTQMLHDHQSATLFRALDDLVETGPTRTNVNDFRAILMDAGINASTDAKVDL